MTLLVKLPPFLWRQFPAILWAAAIFAASSIPGTSLPSLEILGSDKLVHMGVYFVFAMLIFHALRTQDSVPWLAHRAVLLTVILCAVYGITDEVHQSFVEGRSSDVYDWIADVLGGVLGVLSARWITRKRSVGPR